MTLGAFFANPDAVLVLSFDEEGNPVLPAVDPPSLPRAVVPAGCRPPAGTPTGSDSLMSTACESVGVVVDHAEFGAAASWMPVAEDGPLVAEGEEAGWPMN